MKTYYAITFGTPRALENSNIEGTIVTAICAEKSPSRAAIQRKEEKHGFRGYVHIMRSDRFEKSFDVQGNYFYKK